MKKSKFLVALACFGLLVTGCNKPAASSEAKPTSTSGAASQPASTPASTPASNPQSSAPTSSSQAPAHEHSYQAVGSAVKNADGKDVFLKECTAKDSKYIGIAFDDYSEKSADFGSTSGYNNVPEELRNESRLLAKNSTVTWKINIDKAISNAKIAFGVVYTGNDHGSQGAADGGTVKYSVQINANDFVDWDIGEKTYDDLGLSQTARGYVEYVTANLVAGENKITLRQNNAGYRLLYGGEVRVMYTGDAVPVAGTPAFEGYKVTFSGEHCKVYVYDTKDYTKTPKETNSCVAKDEEGNIVAYDPEDEQLQPQVNFKVVCDEGYSLNASNFKITGKYNKLKQGPAEADGLPDAEHFRITKVQEDLAVVITPVQGEQAKGYKMTFAATNCSVKVYIGPKNAEGTNLDTAEEGVYYARSKDSPYDFTFSAPQLNFEVVCDDGYEFNPEIDAEGKVNFITFVAAEGKIGYNKFKANEDGTYNMTKIDSDLTITIAATQKVQPIVTKVVDFSAKTASHSAYYDTWTYGDVTVAGGANNNGAWAFVKMGGKSATISAADHPGTYIKTDTAVAYSVASVTIKYVGKCYNQDSEKATVKVESYSDAALTTKVAETEAKVVPEISTNEGIEEVTYAFTAPQAANLFYKVHFDIINTTTFNGVVALEKITFNAPVPPVKTWDAAAIKTAIAGGTATEVTGKYSADSDETFTAYKIGTAGMTVTLTVNSEAAQHVKLQLKMATKFSNLSKCGIWWQLPNGKSALEDVVQKTQIKLGDAELPVPEEKSLTYTNLASYNPVQSPDAKDGSSALSAPVWVNMLELDLAAGDNTITIKYLDGGYSYWIAGAQLVK